MERATKEIEAADRYSEVDLPAQDLALGQDLRKGDQMKLQESQLWESGLHALWWLHGCWGRLARSGSGSADDSRKLTSDVPCGGIRPGIGVASGRGCIQAVKNLQLAKDRLVSMCEPGDLA